MESIVLNELFGPTIQGEGPHMGQLAYFVRFFGCPLGCVFCDTPYTWRTSENRPHNQPEVYDPKDESWCEVPSTLIDYLDTRWRQNKFNLLVITGGEPLLQGDKIEELLKWERIGKDVHVDIETAGFIEPDLNYYINPAVSFNVSVKLGNSLVPYHKRINFKAITRFCYHPRAIFKFVVSNEDDIAEIKELREQFSIPNRKIWLMPQCITRSEHLDRQGWVVEQAIKNEWNFSPRLQILLWDIRRKV